MLQNKTQNFILLSSFLAVISVALLFLILAGSVAFAQSHEHHGLTNGVVDVQSGKMLFQKKCAVCHGSEGVGGVGVPLNLHDFLRTTSNRYLLQTIRMGRPGRVMPAFSTLTKAQVQSIILYIRSWRPEIEIPVYSLDLIEGDVKKGQVTYDAACDNCHREKGIGGEGTGVTFSRPRNAELIAPAIGNSAFLAAASDQMIKRIIMTGRESTPMDSAMAMGLKEEDVDNVVTYLRSLEENGTVQKVKHSQRDDAVLMYESSYSIEETIENMKRAALGHNFRYIREQTLDHGFVEKDQESNHEYLIYFCNFTFLNQALLVDPRIGMFLPFRTTIVKKEDTVLVMTVSPDYLCSLFNNNELKQSCHFMAEKYEAMLEESTF